MAASKLSSISQADTDERMGEFWDTHDFTDFDNPELPDVKFVIACAVPIRSSYSLRLRSRRITAVCRSKHWRIYGSSRNLSSKSGMW